jgi:hypothetical protein
MKSRLIDSVSRVFAGLLLDFVSKVLKVLPEALGGPATREKARYNDETEQRDDAGIHGSMGGGILSGRRRFTIGALADIPGPLVGGVDPHEQGLHELDGVLTCLMLLPLHVDSRVLEFSGRQIGGR